MVLLQIARSEDANDKTRFATQKLKHLISPHFNLLNIRVYQNNTMKESRSLRILTLGGVVSLLLSATTTMMGCRRCYRITPIQAFSLLPSFPRRNTNGSTRRRRMTTTKNTSSNNFASRTIPALSRPSLPSVLCRKNQSALESKPGANTNDEDDHETVAIIGGGIAGLSCAQQLSAGRSLGISSPQYTNKYDVTVYDTGRLRPGGRASSRQPQDRPKQQKPKGPTGPSSTDEDYPLLSRFRYDHAAQFITTATTSTETLATSLWRTDFDRQVQRWIDRDILMEAPNNSMYVFEQRHNNNNNNNNNNDYEWTVNCLNPDSSSSSSSSSSDSSNTKNEVVQKPTAVRFSYPTGGMSSLVDALIEDGDDNNNTNDGDSSDRRRGSKKKNFVIKQDVWVSPSSGVRYTNNDNNNGRQSTGSTNVGCWTVRAEGKTLGHYDHLIIAHNGKCADRLMSKSPAKDVHKLLRTNFNDRVPKTGGQKMTLNSIYSLTLCVQKGVISNLLAPMLRNEPSSSSPSGGFVGAFIQNHPQLGSVICQTNKYPRSTYSSSNNENDDVELWTILSTASFAKRNKAPQEFLPNDVIQDVTRILVDAFEHDILLQQSSSNDDAVKLSLRNQILESRLQLWGAAVPLNVWRGSSGSENNDSNAGTAATAAPGFIHDPRYQVGVCGDWLLEPSIAGAWTSGRRLAHHLLNDDTTGNHRKETDGVGFLNGYFEASESVRQLGLASLDGPMNSSSNNQTRNLSSPLSNQKKENVRRTDQKNGSNENTNTKKKRMNHQGKKQTEQNQNRKANNSSQQQKKKRIGT